MQKGNGVAPGSDPRHAPVLLGEVIEYLGSARPGSTIVDATVGLGGHAEALLEAAPEARLIGIDRDPAALEVSRERLARFGGRVLLREGRHESIIEILNREGVTAVSGALADLGVSSMQLDDASRGFSFRFDAPLDMRMGNSGPTAADLIETLDEGDIVEILQKYGEEPMARRIARAIVVRRSVSPIRSTAELVEIVHSVRRPRFDDRIDPATLTFQAFRIATNGELTGLEQFLRDAVGLLEPEGRFCVISFHSLEDRIVKGTFRSLGGECLCPPGMPVCGCGAVAEVDVVTRKAVKAGGEETERNPRARSARLRVVEKKVGGDGKRRQ